MTRYNWQQSDWPHFRYDLSVIEETLFAIAEKTGLIKGKLAHLTNELQLEAFIDCMIEEAVKTSEIEGEYINRQDVRSSIKNKLGLSPAVPVRDKRAHGLAELMLDVRDTFKQPITDTHLFEWHLMLSSSFTNPTLWIASWRVDEEPMQIISERFGKRVLHFEAPPAKNVPQEMKKFIDWFNETAPDNSHAKTGFAPVRAAIAHLYFESIHPFDDGNGRIGRAIAEKALAQGFGYPTMLSLSQAIEADKKSYYAALQKASKSNEITAWIEYFVKIILQAQVNTEAQINFILQKAGFFDAFQALLNARELKVLQRMWQAGVQGFDGGMSAKKYMIIADTSKATATRDLQHLHDIKALKQIGSGRSVRYELNI